MAMNEHTLCNDTPSIALSGGTVVQHRSGSTLILSQEAGVAESSDVVRSGVAFIDTETLGLDADVHPVWEVGLILPTGQEETFKIEVTGRDITLAYPKALEISRFEERYRNGPDPMPPADAAAWLAHLIPLHCHLAGAVVSFDEERLRRLLWRHGFAPPWHYHLIDVETLAVGYLAGVAFGEKQSPPWDSESLSRAVNVNPDDFDRHTALGDARWAKAVYDAVIGKD